MHNQSEKRRHVRLRKPYEVEIREFAFPVHSQPVIEVHSVDISGGGLLVQCFRKFSVGDKLHVTIYIPSLNKFHPGFFKVFESDLGQSLTAVAEVVRIEEIVPLQDYAVGVRFLDIYEDDWQALKNMILTALRKQQVAQ